MFFFMNTSSAQVCEYETILESTPTSRFALEGATAIDSKTNLEWQRCHLGTTWNHDNSSCESNGDSETYDWESALQVATANSLGDNTDWRIPNIKELASIIEGACYDPAINTEVFPDTPSEFFRSLFWTSSPSNYNDNASWTIEQHLGAIYDSLRGDRNHIRLVRSR